ncbi:MAG: F0F1 ATP synthase subunit epsilon [Candidatus Pacebacteria bacterium]|nr:F0F1 ATP synthase subunit epsilon [Candidatus Paceibacterota bacterium]
MHVRIHSITTTLFDGEALSLTCPTTSGEISVLAHHRPLITEVTKGMMKIVDAQGAELFVPVTSGFLEVSAEGTISVLVD